MSHRRWWDHRRGSDATVTVLMAVAGSGRGHIQRARDGRARARVGRRAEREEEIATYVPEARTAPCPYSVEKPAQVTRSIYSSFVAAACSCSAASASRCFSLVAGHTVVYSDGSGTGRAAGRSHTGEVGELVGGRPAGTCVRQHRTDPR